MSTPTTATATLPPHSRYHHPHYPYSHQQYQASTATGSSSYRQPANPALPTSSSTATTRLPPSYASSSSIAYSISSSASHAGPNGLGPSASSATSRILHNASSPDTNYSVTTSTTMPTNTHPQSSGSGRKRRRSREPDWNKFYKNGLPKEIIVIDDTPEPEHGKVVGNGVRVVSNGNANAITTNGVSTRPVPKKRKRDDEPQPYDPVYHNKYAGSHTTTPHHNGTPNGSTISTDRTTNSAIHTTAATSLSSNGQEYYDAQPGQKRKRTRQQLAQEAKKREVEGLADPFVSYKPPPYPPKKAPEVHVRVVQDHSYNKNVKVDDDDGHYIVVPDADLTEKYQMVRLLGQGTFGKVVQARDRSRNKAVAIKIIRSVQKYRDASRIELRVLATLKANDAENRNRCIHLRDCFDYRGHICIVMDLLGQSVFDFLKSNSFVPFPNSQIQSFARQLFTSVACEYLLDSVAASAANDSIVVLHDLNLIHTDLKPENILLCDSAYQTFTYNRKIPSSSTTVNRQANQRRVLLDTEIRLIDFGSATFQDEYHSSVVSTRHYRAPEIILGLGWSFPCDIWSIGCILVEFFTGDALFQTHDNLEHLAMMEMVVAQRIDTSLVQAVNKMATRSGGNPASKYFKRLKLDYPTPETTRASKRFVKAMRRLEDIIPSNSTYFKNFLDLLRKIFVYDPQHRITAKQALQHPWFKEPATPDDGTEAAKIRMERLRQGEDHRYHA
ncbi:Dual specificity protein kinase lkh1 [Colletotrichum chlorophyti]|uniref:Dual specificity protein kinase lkh1 n=1 Tax=Colletotrichum chlorophyti TaxID=708187 RepID=A0A1Q8RG52_9PEZI|nr:Dual specificity protein kinase lkh1 [Colletotrichum chlorophyti]